MLEDIYGKPVRFSDLLIKHGISQHQVRNWRQNKVWLFAFLTRVEWRLTTTLAKVFPQLDIRLLEIWYRLGNVKTGTAAVVATKLGKRTNEVQVTYATLLGYLRSEAGHQVLEEAIVAATTDI